MIPRFSLERFCYSEQGTFGTLTLPSGSELSTVEKPWQNNEASVSCIPIGKYKCEPRRFNRGGYAAVEITGVEGRTHILFHIGNTVKDVVGCVAVGTRLGVVGRSWAVINSTDAFASFMSEVGGGFDLTITNKTGGV